MACEPAQAAAAVGVVGARFAVRVRGGVRGLVNAVSSATEPCRVRPERLVLVETLQPRQRPAQLASWG